MEILKTNYVVVAFGIVFAFPIARFIVKKIGEFLAKHKCYGLVRISQTIFTAVIFAMYTVISYHGVK